MDRYIYPIWLISNYCEICITINIYCIVKVYNIYDLILHSVNFSIFQEPKYFRKHHMKSIFALSNIIMDFIRKQ